jgi:hypothetical protein
MRDMLNRAVVTTDRGPVRAPATRAISAVPATMTMQAYQGRANAALYLADSILRQVRRDTVSPDMENGDATVGDGSPEQDMEPLDPTIEAQMDDEEDEDEQPRNEDRRYLPRQDGEEEDKPTTDEEEESVEVIAIEVDTGDEDEYPPEELAP